MSLQASIFIKLSNRIESKNRFVSVKRIESNRIPPPPPESECSSRKSWCTSQSLPCAALALLVTSFGGVSAVHIAFAHGTDHQQDTTKCGARRICGAARYWSVLITWLIRILSLFPTLCIQQSATLTLTVTLQWSLILEIRKLSPFRSVSQIGPAPHFVACHNNTTR